VIVGDVKDVLGVVEGGLEPPRPLLQTIPLSGRDLLGPLPHQLSSKPRRAKAWLRSLVVMGDAIHPSVEMAHPTAATSAMDATKQAKEAGRKPRVCASVFLVSCSAQLGGNSSSWTRQF